MNFLRDPIWTFVGIVVGAIVGGAAIYFPLRRTRKALSYEVVSNVPIVTVQRGANNVVTENIEIRYKDKPVHDVRLIVVRVWNSGKLPIVPDDYVESITITFWGNMLASDIVETSPASLKRNVIGGGGIGPGFQAVALRNILLNPGDSVTVQALMTDFTGRVDADARIAGVSSIQQAKVWQRRWGGFKVRTVTTRG